MTPTKGFAIAASSRPKARMNVRCDVRSRPSSVRRERLGTGERFFMAPSFAIWFASRSGMSPTSREATEPGDVVEPAVARLLERARRLLLAQPVLRPVHQQGLVAGPRDTDRLVVQRGGERVQPAIGIALDGIDAGR